MRRWLGLLLCVAVLSGCSRPDQQLADEAAVLAAVRRFYDASAIEEKGLCRQPVMGGVSGYEVLDRSDDTLVLDVGYAYSDPNAKLKGECRRWASRTFTVAKGVDGYQVTKMTGEQGIGIRMHRMLLPKL